jgi:7-carboxy-7-deazaguanine synthase
VNASTTPHTAPRKLPPHGSHPSTAPIPRLAAGTAVIQEVFSSIQGEALYCGERQIFVRVAHCHLNCHYCDTPMTTPEGHCLVEVEAGSGAWVNVPGLQRAEDTEMLIAGLQAKGQHHCVSLTGGEPLLYPAYVNTLFKRVQALGLKTYLETSGTQPQALAKVLAHTDIVSMDVKLPSTTKQAARWQQHADFYVTAKQADHVELFMKCVVNDETTLDELLPLMRFVTDRATPIFLQPETDIRSETGLTTLISPQHLLALHAGVSEHFCSVRVIPQAHKMLNLT